MKGGSGSTGPSNVEAEDCWNLVLERGASILSLAVPETDGAPKKSNPSCA